MTLPGRIHCTREFNAEYTSALAARWRRSRLTFAVTAFNRITATYFRFAAKFAIHPEKVENSRSFASRVTSAASFNHISKPALSLPPEIADIN